MFGTAAIDRLAAGESGVVVVLSGREIGTVDLTVVAGKVRRVPLSSQLIRTAIDLGIEPEFWRFLIRAILCGILSDGTERGRYRVNGIMVNMPEFAHAFACKVAQPMVSAKRCRVW